MKRKVIQIGNSTQLVSLPRQWALRQKLKKGDEIEVDDSGDVLRISAGKRTGEPKRIELDVSRLGRIVIKVIASLYKAGYDEIALTFSSEQELQWIQRGIQNNCIGMEIIEQGRNRVVAKKILDTIDTEFESVLRRTVIFLNTIAADCLEAARSGDGASVNAVLAMDVNINKFTCFCRRVLNTRGHPQQRLAPPLYCIVEQMEEVGDIFKDICRFYRDERIRMNPSLQQVFGSVVGFLRDVQELLYKFDVVRLRELGERVKVLSEELGRVGSKIEKRELKAVFYTETALDRVWGLTGPMITLLL